MKNLSSDFEKLVKKTVLGTKKQKLRFYENKPSFWWSPALSEDKNLILRLNLEKLTKMTIFGPKKVKLRFFGRKRFCHFFKDQNLSYYEKIYDWIWRN